MKVFRHPFVLGSASPPRVKIRRPIFAPLPRKFDFGLTSSHPLVPLPAVMMFLDKSARNVLKLIESGQLRWAFDLRSPGSKFKLVRVFRRSIFEYAGFLDRDHARAEIEQKEFDEVMSVILPKGVQLSAHADLHKPVMQSLQRQLRITPASFQRLLFPKDHILRAADVARCFSCNNQHVINLIRHKSLERVNLRQGPKASPLITRPSVVEFLKQRRMS